MQTFKSKTFLPSTLSLGCQDTNVRLQLAHKMAAAEGLLLILITLNVRKGNEGTQRLAPLASTDKMTPGFVPVSLRRPAISVALT